MDKKEVIKGLSKWLDSKVELDKWIGGIGGKIAESFDGAFFKVAIEYGFSKLPESYKDEALSVMDSISKGNYKSLGDDVVSLLVEQIKTPLGDEKEKIIIGGVWDIIKGLALEEKSVVLASTSVGGGGHGDDPTDD